MDARTRLGWIRLYEEIGKAGVVCRRCGIAPDLTQMVAALPSRGRGGARNAQPSAAPLTRPQGLRWRGGADLAPAPRAQARDQDAQERARPPARAQAGARHHPQGPGPPRREPAQATPPQAQGHPALQPARPRRSRADGHLQDQARPLPVHRHRRLLTLADGGPAPGQGSDVVYH
jgi:hypothetical protein